MRTLAAAGLLFLFVGYGLAQSTPADPAPTPIPTVTIHVNITPKVAAAVGNKMAVGDKCMLANVTKNNNGTYALSVVDSTAEKAVRAAGTLEETNLLANVDLKKLTKVSWVIAEGDKARGKDIITLTTTETLPTKN